MSVEVFFGLLSAALMGLMAMLTFHGLSSDKQQAFLLSTKTWAVNASLALGSAICCGIWLSSDEPVSRSELLVVLLIPIFLIVFLMSQMVKVIRRILSHIQDIEK